MARRADTVGYHENSLTAQVDLFKYPQQSVRRTGIQRTGRLIRKKDSGIGDQRPGLSLIHILKAAIKSPAPAFTPRMPGSAISFRDTP